eukprot:GHVT01090832.1.p2 GENE.GHVT01090832.1~~GHVT01090832.1.p2  ORF type:complete len:104 (+),score=3.97 GHVT01090832.1:625-936(+)
MRYRIKFILLINAIWFISMDLPRQFASAQIDSFTRRVALRGFHGSPLANVLLADEGRPCRRTGEFCNGPGSCCTGELTTQTKLKMNLDVAREQTQKQTLDIEN